VGVAQDPDNAHRLPLDVHEKGRATVMLPEVEFDPVASTLNQEAAPVDEPDERVLAHLRPGSCLRLVNQLSDGLPAQDQPYQHGRRSLLAVHGIVPDNRLDG
jgi:hypothetical protein